MNKSVVAQAPNVEDMDYHIKLMPSGLRRLRQLHRHSSNPGIRHQRMLVTFVIITLLIVIQSVDCINRHNPIKIQDDINEMMKDFSEKCEDTLKRHVVEEQIPRRPGFRNYPGLRKNPDFVRSCAMTLVGEHELPDRDEQYEKICNAIYTCISHLDSSAGRVGITSGVRFFDLVMSIGIISTFYYYYYAFI